MSNHTYGWRKNSLRPTPNLYSLPRELSPNINGLPSSAGSRHPWPAFDQLSTSSCTGNSTASHLKAVWDKLKINPGIFPSRLALYLGARKLENSLASDCGAEIFDVFAALQQFGVPPELGISAPQASTPEGEAYSEPWYWPFDESKVTQDMPAQCYEDALQHKTLQYLELNQTLSDLKGCIAEGFSFVCGISLYGDVANDGSYINGIESSEAEATGRFKLMPSPTAKYIGGHAIEISMYDDAVQEFSGPNSWGPKWGDAGYLHISYSDILNPSLTDDFATIRLQR